MGDSPSDPSSGGPLWAQPNFDDSEWETVDLTPPEGSFEPIQGLPGYVPGWTSKGHPGYWGYAWYRIRVQIEDATPLKRKPPKLALEGPAGFDTGYQLFVNGKLLGGFGDFSGKTPVEYYNVPTLFPLPNANGNAAGSGESSQLDLLAFRVWMGPGTLQSQPEAGGLHNPPVLGEANVVAADYHLRWLDLVRALLPSVVSGLLHLLLALMAFSLVLFDRTDRVYLWIGAVFLLQAFYACLEAFDSWTQHLSIMADGLLGDCLTFSLIMAGWVIVWWIWFGRRPSWIPRAQWLRWCRSGSSPGPSLQS